MKQVVDIIEDFINSLDFRQDVLSCSNDGVNTTVMVDNLFHAREKLKVTVEGDDYDIVSITAPDTLVFKGVVEDALSVKIQLPKYFHGTPLATRQSLALLNKDWRDKLPFIYLLEIVSEQVDDDRESSIDRVVDLRLFFLDDSSFADWTTDDHYSKRLNGLRLLADAFMEQAKIYPMFGKIDSHKVITHANFGTYADSKGHTNSVFDEELSGVEVQVSLPILKRC